MKVSAEVAAPVLEGLANENRLTAANLVDVSRPEDAPLHPEFEWRDDVAAERWREEQARQIIRCIRVVSEEDDVMLSESGGVMSRVPASDINVYKRDVQGVIIMRIEEGNKLVGMERVAAEEESVD